MSDDAKVTTLSTYDRMMGQLDGLPGHLRSKPVTLRTIAPVVGVAQTFIVQTFQQRETRAGKDGKETTVSQHSVFIEYFGPEGVIRLALPPVVSDQIHRQREDLITRARKRAARQAVETRRANKGSGGGR